LGVLGFGDLLLRAHGPHHLPRDSSSPEDDVGIS
jgi:hypothetical protein